MSAPARCSFGRFLVVFLSLTACSKFALAQEPPAPLAKRIDAVLHSQPVPLEADVQGDAEFLRRVTLDLTGTIPTSTEARAFLGDPTPHKRELLVDRLLADPRFARQMQITFDVWLMERRPSKHVPIADWQKFLHAHFAKNTPLNEIVKDVLAADGTEDKKRAAARFYLDRDGEKNLITRDVGRVFLGRDIQCSQCHDHPLVDDYLQADYYGVFSFFNRSFLFTDTKEKKSYFAENAEGDLVDFKSVFGGDAQKARPHLPGGFDLDEPRMPKGQEYVIAPAKDVRPVPKYSRRERFAQELAAHQNRQLARTFANRLWGHMFGRGLVYPYDMDHSDNPPSHPELLDLLTDELIALKFDGRQFLKHVALSAAYQRSSVMPVSPLPDKAALDQRVTEAKTKQEQIGKDLDAAEKAVIAAGKELEAPTKAVEAAILELAKADAAAFDLQKKINDIAAAIQGINATIAQKTETQKSLADLAATTKQVQAKIPGDPSIAMSVQLFEKKAAALTTEIAAANAMLAPKMAEQAPLMQQLAPLAEAVNKAVAARDAANAARLPVFEKKRAAEIALAAIKKQRDLLNHQEDDNKILADYVLLVSQTPSDPAVVNAAYEKWSERWTKRFFVGSLRPLTPEQLALATLQATGRLEVQRVASEAAEKAALQKENKTAEPAEFAARVEQSAHNALAGEIASFIGVLAPGSGPGITEYQSTVQEALFLKNGPKVSAWAKPSGGNLAERLLKLATPAEMADELYLSVLTRRPTSEEAELVAKHMIGRDADKAVAIEEMIWGLLTSAEFRFSH